MDKTITLSAEDAAFYAEGLLEELAGIERGRSEAVFYPKRWVDLLTSIARQIEAAPAVEPGDAEMLRRRRDLLRYGSMIASALKHRTESVSAEVGTDSRSSYSATMRDSEIQSSILRDMPGVRQDVEAFRLKMMEVYWNYDPYDPSDLFVAACEYCAAAANAPADCDLCGDTGSIATLDGKASISCPGSHPAANAPDLSAEAGKMVSEAERVEAVARVLWDQALRNVPHLTLRYEDQPEAVKIGCRANARAILNALDGLDARDTTPHPE